MEEHRSSEVEREAQDPPAAPAVRLRDQHAAVTKRALLQAARRRFAANGYAATSVRDIAAEAGVAVQTLYSAFGSKAGVLRGLTDLIDEEAGVLPLFEAMMRADDPRDALPLFARIRRQIREQCGDLIDMMRAGARVDADIAAAWDEGMRRRHAGLSRLVERLAQAKALRPDVDQEKAADVLAALVTDDVCDVLVGQRGWTYDDYESWLIRTMAEQVLTPKPRRRP
jgi:AcrR family transcriptional regulator